MQYRLNIHFCPITEALDVIGIDNQDTSFNVPQRAKRQTKEQIQSFTNEERRVAGVSFFSNYFCQIKIKRECIGVCVVDLQLCHRLRCLMLE